MLSYYGVIPERVVEITSVNTERTTLYATDIGRFRYRVIPERVFSHGVHSLHDGSSNFIAATIEKTILDTLYLSNENDLFSFLTEGLRIEFSDLCNLDLGELEKISTIYNKKFSERISKLVTLLPKGKKVNVSFTFNIVFRIYIFAGFE